MLCASFNLRMHCSEVNIACLICLFVSKNLFVFLASDSGRRAKSAWCKAIRDSEPHCATQPGAGRIPATHFGYLPNLSPANCTFACLGESARFILNHRTLKLDLAWNFHIFLQRCRIRHKGLNYLTITLPQHPHAISAILILTPFSGVLRL